MNTPDGLLIVDKPAGWTSHDVVARCRRLCGTRKVGHAGTLDPMATGVLVLGINRATKLLTFLVGCDKTYTATIRLGQSTVTDDAEGEIMTCHDVSGLNAEAIARVVAELTGEISQVPSSVSAIKVDGQRSYARVRAGQDVVLPPRPVTVGRFDILGQRVINSPRMSTFAFVATGPAGAAPLQDLGFENTSYWGSSAAAGMKVNVVPRLLINFNLRFALNNGGLTDRIAPLLGAEFAF